MTSTLHPKRIGYFGEKIILQCLLFSDNSGINIVLSIDITKKMLKPCLYSAPYEVKSTFPYCSYIGLSPGDVIQEETQTLCGLPPNRIVVAKETQNGIILQRFLAPGL